MSIFKNRSNVISYTVNKEIGSNCYVSVDGGEVVPIIYRQQDESHQEVTHDEA